MWEGEGGYAKHRDGRGGAWLDGDEEEAAGVGCVEGRLLRTLRFFGESGSSGCGW